MNAAAMLLLEPDILIRHPLAEYLRDCGYRVVEAVSVPEAREIILHSQDGIDAVLAAVDSPGENVFAFAHWLRAEHPGIDVVLAGSVDGAAQRAERLCEDGPALHKPYDHKLVLERIRWLRARRSNGRTQAASD